MCACRAVTAWPIFPGVPKPLGQRLCPSGAGRRWCRGRRAVDSGSPRAQGAPPAGAWPFWKDPNTPGSARGWGRSLTSDEGGVEGGGASRVLMAGAQEPGGEPRPCSPVGHPRRGPDPRGLGLRGSQPCRGRPHCRLDRAAGFLWWWGCGHCCSGCPMAVTGSWGPPGEAVTLPPGPRASSSPSHPSGKTGGRLQVPWFSEICVFI